MNPIQKNWQDNTNYKRFLKKYSKDPKKTVFFIGAGLSMPLFPSWADLLKKMVNEVHESGKVDDGTKNYYFKQIESGNKFLNIASYCADQLGIRNLRRLLENSFSKKFEFSQIPENYAYLLSMSHNTLVTTNYDLIPDKSSEYITYTNSNIAEANRARNNGEKTLVKIHGDIRQHDSIVFTSEDYNSKMHRDNEIKNFLSTIFTEYTVCFIGFGLNDPHISSILDFLNTVHDKLIQDHYAFFYANNEYNVEEKERELNINIIPYKPSNSGHPEILDFLKSLTESRKPKEKLTKLKTEKIENEYFEFSKKVKDITVVDILDQRAHTYREFYHKREIDDAIYNRLKDNKSILLIGNSLSGKTRAIFELLKKEAFQDYYIIKPELTNFERFPFDQLPENTENTIVFLDDIDKFYDKKNINPTNSVIKKLMRNKVIFIATCRTGPEHKTFSNQAGKDLYDKFDGEIKIPNKIDKDTIIENIKKESIEIDENDEKNFDGNIGSLFLPLTIMKKRYRDLWKSGKKVKKIAIEILDILKAFYVAGNYKNKSSYDIKKIKDYHYRMKNYKPRGVMTQIQRELFKLRKPEIQKFDDHWKDAVDLLRSAEFKLHFVEEIEGQLRIEEAYFDKKVVAPDYRNINIYYDIEQYYPNKQERQEKGFFAKLRAFNIAISQAKTYQEALKLFKKMKTEKIKPDVITFNSLIKLAGDLKTAEALLEKMKTEKIKPDVITFTTLIEKARDLKTAEALLEKMKTEKIKPDVITFTTLIEKARDLKTAEALLEKMKTEKIKPNVITFNSLIKLAGDLKTAEALLEKMKTEKIKPDVITFTTLIEKARDLKTAEALLEKMKTEKIKPDVITFRTLANIPNLDHLLFIRKYVKDIVKLGDDWRLKYFAAALERKYSIESRDLAFMLLDKVKIKDSSYFNLVANLYRRENKTKALEFYLKAAELEKNQNKKAKYYHNIAQFIYQYEDIESALNYCQKALFYNANFAYSKILLLCLLACKSDPKELIHSLNVKIEELNMNRKKALLKIKKILTNLDPDEKVSFAGLDEKVSLLEREIESML